MRSAALVLFLSSIVIAADPLVRVAKDMARGTKEMAVAATVKSDSKKLKAFQKAKPYFKRSRTRAMKALKKTPSVPLTKAVEDATNRLVAVLNAETILYLKRGAYSTAKKRNAEAVALLPDDAETKDLKKKVADPPSSAVGAGYSKAAFRDATALRTLLRDRHQAQQRFAARRPVRQPVR